MKNVIYYFTGTGNSLAVASHIADAIGDTEVISIMTLQDTKKISEEYERVGFVYPVYYYHIPGVVNDILSNIKFNKNQYTFGIITYGAMSGMAMYDLRNIVEGNGGSLSGEFGILMPGNYIVQYGAFPDAVCNLLFKREGKAVIRISESIKNKETTHKITANLFANLYKKKANREIAAFASKDKDFRLNSNCTSCELCSKVCPVGNIDLNDGKPVWKNKCEQCMACIQGCPSNAIKYLDKDRKRYFHPEIKVKDLIQSK